MVSGMRVGLCLLTPGMILSLWSPARASMAPLRPPFKQRWTTHNGSGFDVSVVGSRAFITGTAPSGGAVRLLALAGSTSGRFSRCAAASHRTRRLSRAQWARIQREIDQYVFVIHPVNLGCALPGVKAEIAAQGALGHPTEAFERLRVVRNVEGVFVNQLNELRGYVHITDAEAALRYVRLYTAPETWFLWRRKQWEAEVMAAGPDRRLPNFGLHQELDYGTLGNGWFGVIPPELFRSRGFTPAGTRTVEDGFVIDRWLLVGSPRKPPIAQHVEETVRPDGGYQRRVLETRPAEGMRFPRWE